jgi:hypothetical protein
LILAIALGDFRIKLRKNDIRNAVKEEIWKAALRELHSNENELDIEKKKILFYYRFGSSKKRKRKNYMLQLGDETICKLYEWETFRLKASIWKNNKALQLVHKYHLKNYFGKKIICPIRWNIEIKFGRRWIRRMET